MKNMIIYDRYINTYKYHFLRRGVVVDKSNTLPCKNYRGMTLFRSISQQFISVLNNSK